MVSIKDSFQWHFYDFFCETVINGHLKRMGKKHPNAFTPEGKWVKRMQIGTWEIATEVKGGTGHKS